MFIFNDRKTLLYNTEKQIIKAINNDVYAFVYSK